eukprot:683745-Rhodomonas_salina.1
MRVLAVGAVLRLLPLPARATVTVAAMLAVTLTWRPGSSSSARGSRMQGLAVTLGQLRLQLADLGVLGLVCAGLGALRLSCDDRVSVQGCRCGSHRPDLGLLLRALLQVRLSQLDSSCYLREQQTLSTRIGRAQLVVCLAPGAAAARAGIKVLPDHLILQ